MVRARAAIGVMIGLALSLAPVGAEEGSAAKSDEPAKAVAKGSKTGLKEGLRNLPMKLVAVTCGTIVGTPVAMFRRSCSETVAATKDLTGETSNPILLGLAGTFGLPAGVLSGTLQGPFYAMYNSWTNEPFGKDSFSLGDMK